MLEKPELIEEAKKELRRRVGTEGYIPPIPEGIRPMAINQKIIGRKIVYENRSGE